MRIFQMITVSEYGGAQSVVAGLCRELARKHEVFLVYSGEGEAFAGLDPGIVHLRIGPHRKEISWKDLFVWLRFLYYRLKYHPDLVHLHSSKMGALGRMAFPKKKTVYTVHGFDSIRVAFRKFLFLERLLSRKTGAIAVVSRDDLEGMKAEKIHGHMDCVYNGVEDFSCNVPDVQTDSTAAFLQKLKEKYDRVIISIARIAPPKDFTLFCTVANALPQYAFVWIGGGKCSGELPANVYCPGAAPLACRYLSYADAFILTSGYEGLPISIIEALSFSKPIVASRVGGIPELVHDDKNGYAVDNEPEKFIQALSYLFTDEDQYNAMCRYSRDIFLKHFTVEQMVNGYQELYSQLN